MRNIQLLALLLSKIKRRIRCYDIKKILLFAITVLEATSTKVLSSNFNLSRSVSLRKKIEIQLAEQSHYYFMANGRSYNNKKHKNTIQNYQVTFQIQD